MKEAITITKDQFAESVAKAVRNLTEDAPKEIGLQLMITCVAVGSALVKELFDEDEKSVPEAGVAEHLM